MRIITGVYKGRNILMPKGIRPTQNKVRKAVFDIMGDIEGLSFLELFAGSGAVGFEAASRGVSELVLVEQNAACRQAITSNIELLKLSRCTLIPMEAEGAIEALRRKSVRFDIVFLDPPYRQDLAKKTLQMLDAHDIVTPNGFVIVQHSKKDDLPGIEGGLVLFKQASYGDTRLSLYRKEATRHVPKSDLRGDV